MPTFKNSTTGTEHAIVGAAEDGIGAHGASKSNTGVGGMSTSGIGIHGISVVGPGVRGDVDAGVGVFGASKSSTGVSGISESGMGVNGVSKTGDGVFGVGLRGVVGQSETREGVNGKSRDGAGVVGESDKLHGVFGICHNPNGGGIYGHNDAGGFAAVFDGKVSVQGDVMVAGDIHLAGADVAEYFGAADGASLEPGTVTVIGPDGLLAASSTAYDQRVAGVVSGAGQYRPGLLLDGPQSGGRAVIIGLMGKVFCKVDDSSGPILVGDLLTTSHRTGHAMKAVRRELSFGAVIGKALAPHSAGQGLIPVLVTLR